MNLMNWLHKAQAEMFTSTPDTWVSDLARYFRKRPHPVAGKFVQLTKMHLGQVSFINQPETLRITLNADFQFIGVSTIRIHVTSREGHVGSNEMSFQGLKSIVEHIVNKAYEIIDEEINFSREFNLDPLITPQNTPNL
jgi:hypothetical protein